MSGKMQMVDTDSLKRKASDSLIDDDKVLVENSNDSDSDMDDGLISFDMMLAEKDCFSDSEEEEDYTNRKTKTTPPSKKRKMTDNQSEAIGIDHAPRLDTLPMELLQQIIRQLDVKDFLCAKLASSRLYSASKNFRGTDFRRVSAIRYPTRARIFAEFEAHCNNPIKSGKLMCSVCCKSFGNGASGFADEQFKQSLATRKCMKCWIKAGEAKGTFAIRQGTKLYWCHLCHQTKAVDEAATKEDLESFYAMVAWPGGALDSLISNKRFELPKRKMTERTLICRACIPRSVCVALNAHERNMFQAKEAIAAVIEYTYRNDRTMGLMLGLKVPQYANEWSDKFGGIRDAIEKLAEMGRRGTLRKKRPYKCYHDSYIVDNHAEHQDEPGETT